MRSTQIYEFDGFLATELCDSIVAWFSTRPRLPNLGGQQRILNGKNIDYSNIQDYNIKRWVNAFKFDAAAAARKVFGEEYLYPDYTDLVSWESGSGMILHADNCDQEGTPNYCGWRNYSGVLYLNDDFAGGETIFPNQGPIIIKPKKGKLVLYPAGLEYSHVVTTVVGTRYVMPIWFTKDKNYIEV